MSVITQFEGECNSFVMKELIKLTHPDAAMKTDDIIFKSSKTNIVLAMAAPWLTIEMYVQVVSHCDKPTEN